MLYYLWELPQNLLGLLVILFTGAKKDVCIWRTYKFRFGVSLGNYIIFGKGFTNKDYLHEIGHQRQSRMLGPLYLLIIGLPSLIGNIIWRSTKGFDYYKQPWEAQADKLGGVKR